MSKDQKAKISCVKIDDTDFWKIKMYAPVEDAIILIQRYPSIQQPNPIPSSKNGKIVTIANDTTCYVFPFCLRLGNDAGNMWGELTVHHPENDLDKKPDKLLNTVLQQLKWYVWREVNTINTIGEMFIYQEIDKDNIEIETMAGRAGTLTSYCYQDFCRKFPPKKSE